MYGIFVLSKGKLKTEFPFMGLSRFAWMFTQALSLYSLTSLPSACELDATGLHAVVQLSLMKIIILPYLYIWNFRITAKCLRVSLNFNNNKHFNLIKTYQTLM